MTFTRRSSAAALASALTAGTLLVFGAGIAQADVLGNACQSATTQATSGLAGALGGGQGSTSLACIPAGSQTY